MDSNARESSDTKAEFRKPSNNADNRKYRRRSPVGGSSSSSDGCPHRRRGSSPVPSRKDITKFADDKQKRDDDRNQPGRNDESNKPSDWQSSRSHCRHDDYSRRDRLVDDRDRCYSRSSNPPARNLQNSNILDYSRSDREHRSIDYVNGADTSSRAKSDCLGHRSRDKDSYDRAGSDRRNATTEERDREEKETGIERIEVFDMGRLIIEIDLGIIEVIVHRLMKNRGAKDMILLLEGTLLGIV